MRAGGGNIPLEDILDGRVVHPTDTSTYSDTYVVQTPSAEDSSFEDILARFRRRANLVDNKPEPFFRTTDRREAHIRRNLSAEFRQRQNRLRKLVNSGVAHFRNQDYYKARRCWLAALRLDPNCQQAKRNIAVVRKILSKRELN